jgi:hypothetical protein
MRRLLYSFAVGCVFALSTLMMIEFPVLSSIEVVALFQRWFSILLMPGFLIGFAVSGNIHVTSPWVVTSANFVFYFALGYLTVTLWSKIKAKSEARRPISTSGPSTPPA